MTKHTLKNRKAVIIVACIAVVIIAVALGLFISQPKVKEDSFTFEYGKKVEIDTSAIFGDSSDKVKNIEVDYSSLKMVKDKDYPEVGEYELPFTYKTMTNHSDKLKVTVKDTTKPKFTSFSEKIEVTKGDKDFDFKKHFEASDLSSCTIDIDTKDVKFDKEGDYTAKVTATDAHKNKESKKFTVVVKAEEKAVIASAGNEQKVSGTSGTSGASQSSSNSSVKPYYKNGILIVNKKHPVPPGFGGGVNQTALAAVNRMISDMKAEGLSVDSTTSNYRSYSYQSTLYQNYVSAYGQASADTFSARPGYSEHQTGLAFDLREPGGGSLLTNSKATRWVAKNAHKYGLIVRYQSGKEWITGYQAEPWHVRYVGDIATSIYNSGLSLEEYLGVSGGGY